MATAPPFSDPFAAVDGSFVRPNPGGAARNLVPTQAADAAEPAAALHGLNPLLAAANPLLMLVPRLRNTRHVSDVPALRASLVQGLREFATAAAGSGVAAERVTAARYVLCTMLDEAAADTPWGGGGVWGRHSLLAEFHNEVSGGEKVFQLMARLAEKPAAHRDLLELIYAAIALGFEGRFRVVEGGRAQLDAVRARLAQVVREQQGAYPAELAEHWHGMPAPTRRALGWLPLLLTSALAVLALGALYAAFAWSLSGRADPVYQQIQALRLAPPVAAVAQPAPLPRLAQLLQNDIRAGLVAVRDDVDRSVVTIRGDGLFAPASAALAPDREALVQRIAQALMRLGGGVLVTGHTDDQAIRTLRFPSNWHLSDERARAVKELMVRSGLPAERVRAEGRADGERAVPNDTPANRALNRRVEITLFAASEAASRAAAPTGAGPQPGRTPATAPPPGAAAPQARVPAAAPSPSPR